MLDRNLHEDFHDIKVSSDKMLNRRYLLIYASQLMTYLENRADFPSAMVDKHLIIVIYGLVLSDLG